MSRSLSGRRCQGGVSLIEVLIAVLVLSFGLLGLAALQATSLRSVNQTVERFDATNQVYDILDRIRANRAQARAGAYDLAYGAAPGGTNPAAGDLAAWRSALTALPGGDGEIKVDGERVRVSVRWDGPDGAPVEFTVHSEL